MANPINPTTLSFPIKQTSSKDNKDLEVRVYNSFQKSLPEDEAHKNNDEIILVHYLADAYEISHKTSHHHAPIQKLYAPKLAKGVQCTHHFWHIYGAEKDVQNLFRTSEEIRNVAPEIHKLLRKTPLEIGPWRRFGRFATRLAPSAIHGIILMMDIADAIKHDPKRNFANGVIKGSVNFTSHLLLMYLDPLAASVEHASKPLPHLMGQTPDYGKDALLERIAFTMSTGGAFKLNGVPPTYEREKAEKMAENWQKMTDRVAHFIIDTYHRSIDHRNPFLAPVEAPFKFLQFTDYAVRTFVAKYHSKIFSDPDSFPEIARELVYEMKDHIHCPKQGSDEEKAAWARGLVKQSEAKMQELIDAKRESLEKRKQWEEQQARSFGGLFNHLTERDWRVLSGLELPKKGLFSYSEISKPKKDLCLSPLNNDLFRPKPLFDITRPPASHGDIRIQPPDGGNTVLDIAAGTAKGIAAVVSIDFLPYLENASKMLFYSSPVILPAAFAAFVAYRFKSDMDRRRAKTKWDNANEDRLKDNIDTHDRFSKTWKSLIERPIGSLSQNELNVLTEASIFISKKLVKNEHTFTEVNGDKDLPLTPKSEILNDLLSCYTSMASKRNTLENRVEMESFYAQHASASPERVIELLKTAEIANNPAKCAVLIPIFLKSLSVEQAVDQLNNIKSPYVQKVVAQICAAELLNDGMEKAKQLDLKGAVEKWIEYFKERCPSKIFLNINVVGLDARTTADVNGKDGLNSQLKYIYSLPLGQMDTDFVLSVINRIEIMQEKWAKRWKKGKLSWGAHTAVETQANGAVFELRKRLKDKEKFQSILDEINENPAYADIEILFARLQEAFPDTDIAKNAATCSELINEQLHAQFVEINNTFAEIANGCSNASDKENEALTGLKKVFPLDPARFDKLYEQWIDTFVAQGDGSIAEHLLVHWRATSQLFPQSSFALFERSRKPFIEHLNGNLSLRALTRSVRKELNKAAPQAQENLEQLYLGIFLPYIDTNIKRSSEALDVLLRTFLKDLLDHPTYIPGLGQFREEDFANHRFKKMIQGIKWVHDFDRQLLPALFLALMHRDPLQWKGLSKLLWNDSSDFKLKQLKELFWDGRGWTSRKELASLARLLELGTEIWKAFGSSDESTMELAASVVAGFRLLAHEGKLDLFYQLFSLEEFELAYQDVFVRKIEHQGFHLIKKMLPTLIAAASALQQNGFSFIFATRAFNSGYQLFYISNHVNQAVLYNTNVDINNGDLLSAEKKITEIKPKLNRADDLDLLLQLEVSLNFAKALKSKKREYFQLVIEQTEHWLGKAAKKSTSRLTPSRLTLEQRGYALLYLRSELKNFRTSFENLITHFQHRECIPHRLLKALNPGSLAARCHHQLSISQEPFEVQEQVVPFGSIRYFAGAALRKWYGVSRPAPQQPSSPKKQANSPKKLMKELFSAFPQKDEILLQRMENTNLELSNHTMAFIRGEIEVDDLEKLLLTYDYPQKEKYLTGWIAFLLECINSTRGAINADLFQRLDTAHNCGYMPPLSIFCRVLIDQTLLNQFHFDKLEHHKKILIFFALLKSRSSLKTPDGQINRRVVCECIRSVIGSRKRDKKLLELMKGPAHFDSIKKLLSQGASPDQVLRYYTAKNANKEPLAFRVPDAYMLHVLGERRQPELIELWDQFGANFNVPNLFNMNPLEHFLVTVPERSYNQKVDINMCISAYLKGGIDPDKSVSRFLDRFNHFKGACWYVKAANSIDIMNTGAAVINSLSQLTQYTMAATYMVGATASLDFKGGIHEAKNIINKRHTIWSTFSLSGPITEYFYSALIGYIGWTAREIAETKNISKFLNLSSSDQN